MNIHVHRKLIFILSILILMPAAAEAKTFLWQVRSGSNTAYVMGSIHFGRPDFFPLPDAVDSAFKSSEVLAVEADITSQEAMKKQVEMFQKGLLPTGDDIHNHMSERTIATLEKMNIDLTMMTRFKPWLAAMSIQVAEYQKMGLSEMYGVDLYFLKNAKKNKQIKEVEGLDFQMDLFSNMSFEEQDMLMYYTLLFMPEMEDKMNAMIDAWKTGDTASMEHLLFSEVADYPEVTPMVKKMFSDRNRGMADKVEEYLKTGQTHFVVVGAGHLVGPESVIARLKEKGYDIVQQ